MTGKDAAVLGVRMIPCSIGTGYVDTQNIESASHEVSKTPLWLFFPLLFIYFLFLRIYLTGILVFYHLFFEIRSGTFLINTTANLVI